MNPLFATSTQVNILLAVGGVGTLLGSYFFGRLITFVWPNNPLVRKKGNP